MSKIINYAQKEREENLKRYGTKYVIKRKSNLALNLFLIIILLSLVAVGYVIYKDYEKYNSSVELNANIASKTKIENAKFDWEAIRSQPGGENIIAWIYQPSTNINYPIVQGEDNNFYLKHGYDGSWQYAGSIFVDASNKKPFEDFNTIIYGHRMNNGLMFYPLGNYFGDSGFDFAKAKENQIEIYVYDGTKHGKKYIVDVFAASRINARSNIDLYNPAVKSDLSKSQDTNTTETEYLNRVKEVNKYQDHTGNTVDDFIKKKNKRAKDGSRDIHNIVMLSTCTLEAGDQRLVVWGELIFDKNYAK